MKVYINVAIDGIDQWDNACLKAEQAKDNHTIKVVIPCATTPSIACLLQDDDLNLGLVLVMPQALQEQIMKVGQDSNVNCHLSLAKALVRLRKTFYWSGMFKDIKRYCKMCNN